MHFAHVIFFVSCLIVYVLRISSAQKIIDFVSCFSLFCSLFLVGFNFFLSFHLSPSFLGFSKSLLLLLTQSVPCIDLSIGGSLVTEISTCLFMYEGEVHPLFGVDEANRGCYGSWSFTQSCACCSEKFLHHARLLFKLLLQSSPFFFSPICWFLFSLFKINFQI